MRRADQSSRHRSEERFDEPGACLWPASPLLGALRRTSRGLGPTLGGRRSVSPRRRVCPRPASAPQGARQRALSRRDAASSRSSASVERASELTTSPLSEPSDDSALSRSEERGELPQKLRDRTESPPAHLWLGSSPQRDHDGSSIHLTCSGVDGANRHCLVSFPQTSAPPLDSAPKSFVKVHRPRRRVRIEPPADHRSPPRAGSSSASRLAALYQ